MGKQQPTILRCEAEIGRPGAYHACRRPAANVWRTKNRAGISGTTLHYCDAHVNHAGDRRYSGPGRWLAGGK